MVDLALTLIPGIDQAIVTSNVLILEILHLIADDYVDNLQRL